MRVTFIDNLLLEQRADGYHFDLQPHLGLISLLAVLRQGGHHGTLVDPKLEVHSGRLALDASLYESIAELVLATRPDVVGLTSLGCNFMATTKIAAHLRRRSPELPVLLGGPHASILDVPVLERYPQFDLVVRGEAELTLPPLLEALESRRFSALRGITYRDAHGIRRTGDAPLVADLDTLPPAAYDSCPPTGQEMIRVEAGRGCPFACTFCSTAGFFGRRYRLKSADRLCADLDRLHETYGTRRFALTHDLFTVNKAKVREFCEAVAPRGYTWTCSARMDCVDADLLDAMAKAGCRSLYYGVETGSPRMQKVVSKRLDLALYEPTLEATRRAGMAATASFITGYPQETAGDQRMTLDLIGSTWRRFAGTVTTQLHLLTPEPGTELLGEFRDRLGYDGRVTDFNLPALEADDADITAADPEIFVNHHYYEGVLPRPRHVLVTALYQTLCRLSRDVQRHLLARYDDSLSAFTEAVLSRPDAHADADPARLLRDCLTDRWGADDYLVSLVRYLLAATDPAGTACGGPAQRPRPDTADRRRPLRLSSGAAVLRDIHACPEILRVLGEAPAPETARIPEELRTRRGHCLLLPGDRELTVRNLALSAGSVELLAFLEVPRSRPDIARHIGVTDDESDSLDAFLGRLLDLGVLEHGEAPVPAGV
ncbi:hypothetical protein SRB5_30160 [Streptomyces sp. RB5]|uniref:Uncharacterized protein n=1 Tax=Streptomyces smaragdinus TaxID=2585196 RepID=A0A7K0CHB6_9ACTN|nr:radical SAM protein [Streptomyces smaragdinus]MQY12877.1 hypothetical protein [Streptomyces smaragdinus]